ncbi:diguanylate cyclase [Aquabacterium sp.]|uniref:diguanylate cyclase n=1 Tax=Aquabacterium sp. TaxID=1872578 RepID=UPI002486DC39|nr:diguanylate cyclase [Aquabacterium sp.]MDI1259596.1 diguanylate cyclase [Aquabacterium sp.]
MPNPHQPSADLVKIRQQGVHRFVVMLPAYGAVMAILWVGVWLAIVRPAVALVISGVMVFTLVGFYQALRSGAAARTKDPLLAFSQILFNIVLVAMGYAWLDDLRSTALLWLSVIIAFDMWRLPGPQIRAAATFCIVLPLLATAARGWWHPVALDWVHELFTLLMLAVVLPVLFAVSAQARAVRRRHVQQKEQMAQTLAQLHQLSLRDGLTGLYNRRHMLDLLAAEVRRLQRSGQPSCVAILDLDLFKSVNDRFGHAMGDTVLQTFARLGQAVFPGKADALARWGGEEFLLLLPQTTEAEARQALLRLRDEMHRYHWSQHAAGLSVTFSAGVCRHQPDHTLAQTLEQADQALYRAKASGRDCILGTDLAVPPAVVAPLPADAPCARPSVHHTPPAASAIQATAEAATPSTRPPRRSRWEPLLSVVFGRNPRLRPYQTMCLLAACVYLSSIAGFLLYVAPHHLLNPDQALLFVVHNALGALVPYVLLRLGITAHWRDPSLVLLQILWGGTGVIIGYGLMPATSPSTLQMICLSMVFGFSSLRPSETRLVGIYMIALMVGVLGAKAFIGPANFNWPRELLEVSMTCLALWLLTLQSHRLSVTRERVRAEKRALADATEQVNQVMMHDPLTGLFNRQHMQSLLERECDRHHRSDTGFCVALIDLDHFKAVNDTHGHPVGDEVLIGFAQAAQAVLRTTDVICRWGGEEFLVLLIDTDPGPVGMRAVDRLRQHLARQPVCPSQPQLKITLSAGLAEHQQGESIADMLQRADQALYAAKAAGRDRCICAAMSPSQQHDVVLLG